MPKSEFPYTTPGHKFGTNRFGRPKKAAPMPPAYKTVSWGPEFLSAARAQLPPPRHDALSIAANPMTDLANHAWVAKNIKRKPGEGKFQYEQRKLSMVADLRDPEKAKKIQEALEREKYLKHYLTKPTVFANKITRKTSAPGILNRQSVLYKPGQSRKQYEDRVLKIVDELAQQDRESTARPAEIASMLPSEHPEYGVLDRLRYSIRKPTNKEYGKFWSTAKDKFSEREMNRATKLRRSTSTKKTRRRTISAPAKLAGKKSQRKTSSLHKKTDNTSFFGRLFTRKAQS